MLDVPGMRELGITELQQTIADKRAAGEPTFAERVEWHRKLAIPFACLVFAAIGVPLFLVLMSRVRQQRYR